LKQLLHENIHALEEIEVKRNPLLRRVIPATTPLELTADQQAALEQIVGKQGKGRGETSQYSRGAPLRSPWGVGWDVVPGEDRSQRNGGQIAPILLHGVTGSGKTEVYLQALAAIIKEGKRGIVLVPEIALTAQAILRFVGRFSNRVAIIHSELTDGERYDEWRRIRSGTVD